MIPILIKDLFSIAEESFHNKQINENTVIPNFCIDSRIIKKGDAYIAIIGKQFDGNDFIDEAIKKGASIAFTSNPNLIASNVFYVNDGKDFLKQIAKFIIKKIKPTIIGITGSNGKTTTKEIIASIFQQNFSTSELLVSQGNFNNDIGLPLTILRLKITHKIVILEMGMNHAGEINELTKIAAPNIAAITNIGEAHIENFKSKDGIASAKKEILNNISNKGTAILPYDDFYFDFLVKDLLDIKITTFGIDKKSDIWCEETNDSITSYHVFDQTFTAQCKLIGNHNKMNILAAIGVASSMNVPITSIKKGIESIQPVPGRLTKIFSRNGALIIDDSYNANPSSMKAAIDVLTKENSNSKILVIGDMGELGTQSQIFHDDIIHYINNSNINFTFAIGHKMELSMMNIMKNGKWYPSKEMLIDALSDKICKDSVVLVKGSRFMKMEEIIKEII